MEYTISPSASGIEVRLIIEQPLAKVNEVLSSVPAGQNQTLNKNSDTSYELRSANALVSTVTLADQGRNTEAVIVGEAPAVSLASGQSDPTKKFARSLANTLYSKGCVSGADLSRLMVDLSR